MSEKTLVKNRQQNADTHPTPNRRVLHVPKDKNENKTILKVSQQDQTWKWQMELKDEGKTLKMLSLRT